MTLDEIRIGGEFWCSGRRWRCTDVGTRVVVAIRVYEATMAISKDGVVTTRAMSGEEAEAIGWFEGPPYGVVETVFDEDDLGICSLTRTGVGGD